MRRLLGLERLIPKKLRMSLTGFLTIEKSGVGRRGSCEATVSSEFWLGNLGEIFGRGVSETVANVAISVAIGVNSGIGGSSLLPVLEEPEDLEDCIGGRTRRTVGISSELSAFFVRTLEPDEFEVKTGSVFGSCSEEERKDVERIPLAVDKALDRRRTDDCREVELSEDGIRYSIRIQINKR